jgi:hypothetical protein
LRNSVEHFREAIPGTQPEDVMALVLLTQYFDTLKEIGAHAGSTTILLPNSPAANDYLTQILAGLRGNNMSGQRSPAVAKVAITSQPTAS